MSLPDSMSIAGVSVANLVTGVIGGLMRTMNAGATSWRRRVATAIVGGFVSGYGTPVLGPIVASFLGTYSIPPEATFGLVGFILGVTGQTACEAAVIRVAELIRGGNTRF